MSIVKQAIDFDQVASKESLKNALLNLDIQERNIVLAEKVYNTTKIKFEQGLGSSFEVLQADADFQQAQSNYFQAPLQRNHRPHWLPAFAGQTTITKIIKRKMKHFMYNHMFAVLLTGLLLASCGNAKKDGEGNLNDKKAKLEKLKKEQKT